MRQSHCLLVLKLLRHITYAAKMRNFFLDDLLSEADSDTYSGTLDQHAACTQPE
jgi:hypothetical protein